MQWNVQYKRTPMTQNKEIENKLRDFYFVGP